MEITWLRGVVVLFLLAIALWVFARKLWLVFRLIRLGSGPVPLAGIGVRIRELIVQVGGHSRVLRRLASGIMHLFIFWGFLILLTTIMQAFGEAFVRGWTLPWIGSIRWFVFLQDLFIALVLIGIVISLYLRLIVRPRRLAGQDQFGAYLILGLIGGIMVTLLVSRATSIALEAPPWAGGAFLSRAMVGWLLFTSPAVWRGLHEVAWWTHLGIVLYFLTWIPEGKHLHLVTLIPNVFLRKARPRGALRPFDLESAERLGASEPDHFTWKDNLDLFACMECGRCTEVCPANITGKELDPRRLHTDLRKELTALGAARFAAAGPRGSGYTVSPGAGSGNGAPSTPESGNGAASPPGSANGTPTEVGSGSGATPEVGPQRALIGEVFSEAFLWQCLTCGACVEECPAANDHIDKIVDMRRHLVMERAEMPETMEDALRSLEVRNHPFRGAGLSRTAWTAGVTVKSLPAGERAEWLLWVGCAAAMNERNHATLRALVRLLQTAGLDVAILGDEETCNGDPARRMGNEYLFQQMAQRVVETFSRYGVTKIVTLCPHCFNTFKNEYPQFGGRYEVWHHTQLLASLIADGRLRTEGTAASRITFHDPCYLGRHNGEYEAPRQILAALPGATTTEMAQSRDRSFCCGAGGGLYWTEDRTGRRVSHARMNQISATGAGIVATACPFCALMLEDARAATDASVRPLDVAELLDQAIAGPAPPS
jgi:Fe-S oxidoreductase